MAAPSWLVPRSQWSYAQVPLKPEFFQAKILQLLKLCVMINHVFISFSTVQIYDLLYMSGFMKTVIMIAGMLLGIRSDSVHKYGHVVLRVLSTLCTLNRSYTMPMQAFEIAANESNELNKAKLERKLII